MSRAKPVPIENPQAEVLAEAMWREYIDMVFGKDRADIRWDNSPVDVKAKFRSAARTAIKLKMQTPVIWNDAPPTPRGRK